MVTITRFEHPTSVDAPGMFVLRAEADLWAQVLHDKVGDLDMIESAELLYSQGMHPQWSRQIRLVASDTPGPTCEADVAGIAVVELPMADNLELATVSVAVERSGRGQGTGSALHDAALEVASEFGRNTIQSWTCEALVIPSGARELCAETGMGAVEADSRETRFLVDRGYVLGQVEKRSRLHLVARSELVRQRDELLAQQGCGYELLTFLGPVPAAFVDDAARLSAVMARDVPVGAMRLDEEAWDSERVRAGEIQLSAGLRDQVQTFARHAASGSLVGFTRLFRDAGALEVAHQWETLVIGEHRGHGLGMLMKVANHVAMVDAWPEVSRVITGNASENRHMRDINAALGYVPYGANGFWELRRGADG